MSLSRMVEEINSLHQAFFDDSRKMQSLLKKLKTETEILKKKNMDSMIKELHKREAVTEREMHKLADEIKKNGMQNNSLLMASIEKDKADVALLQLFEKQKIKPFDNELKSKMEEMDDMANLNQTLVDQERQSNAELQEARKDLMKRLMEMEDNELKRKLQAVMHLGDEDDDAVHEKKKKQTDNELGTKSLMKCTIRKSCL